MIKVLIIDDEPLIAKLYSKSLDTTQFEVTQCIGDSPGGIDMAKNLKPQIILLDLMMPEMDGIEVLKHLKAEDSTKNIPVVILTNLEGMYDKSYAKSLGASDYWIKGEISGDVLGEKIKALLGL